MAFTLSPLLAIFCDSLLAYIRSAPSAGNDPYSHIYGSLLVLCVIVIGLLDFAPANSSSLWIWVAYLPLWLVPPILMAYCLLLSPLHIIWSPTDLLMRNNDSMISDPNQWARILYDLVTPGHGESDIEAK